MPSLFDIAHTSGDIPREWYTAGGHHWTFTVQSGYAPIGQCSACKMTYNLQASLERWVFDPPPCTATAEKPEASPAPAEAETFTDAERLGLAVVTMITAAQKQRDRAIDLCREALKEWPETSWAHDSLAKDNLEAALAELEDQVTHPQGATLEPRDQGDPSAT